MELQVYKGIEARLADQASFFIDHGHPAIAHIAWYEGQPEAALADENQHIAFNLPAVFLQFDNTTFTPRALSEYTGRVTLHVVQDRVGVNGEQGDNETLLHKLELLTLIAKVLDKQRIDCGPLLRHADQQRDHENRPLLWERIVFTFTGIV